MLDRRLVVDPCLDVQLREVLAQRVEVMTTEQWSG